MTEVQDKRFWLAVYTKPRHEKIADEKLQEKGIESYLPLVKRTRQWKDRKTKVWMPLFKSYLFVHIPLKETLHVVQTYGVHHIVRFSGTYGIMQDDQIEAIRQILEGGFVPESDDYFEVGEEVEISYGPLQGIRGIISTKRNESRFILKVDGINQAISVMIDSNWLMKAKT